jgi:pilus assembly protein CpaE
LGLSKHSMSIIPIVGLPSSGALSAVLIVPDRPRRAAFAKLFAGLNVSVVREYTDYPGPEAIQELQAINCDIFIVDLDGNVGLALASIEAICSRGDVATVMAASLGVDSGLLMRSMHVGAREFLTEPVAVGTMKEALARALERRVKSQPPKAAGKMLVCTASKGGAGATTIATNLAVALAEENAGKVVLVDLDVRLGETALQLGLVPKFSIVDAVNNIERLDAVFLLGLLVKHTSGLSLLAAPDLYASFSGLGVAIAPLFRILRDEFPFVVVDAGPIPGIEDLLFDLADTIYLLAEPSIPSLRNARRMLNFIAGREHLASPQVVLNRYNSKEVDIDDTTVIKALARPISWKVPNDFLAVRSAYNTGIPLVMKDSAISRVIRQMSKAACGKAPVADKKTRSMFSLLRRAG